MKSGIRARVAKAESWICPDCESKLEEIPAKKMHKAHKDTDKARGCTNPKCDFMCYFGDDND